MKFFIATKNAHKLIELERILKPMGFEVISQKDLSEPFPEVEETGTTFEENAMLKAEKGMEITGCPSVADDSGICVNALGGAPGIYSARYSGFGDKENNEKLLKDLENTKSNDRSAYYVSAIACVFPDGRKFTVRGECHGLISREYRGNNGFGYDPLFITETGLTFGEMDAEAKDKISHRGKSLKAFKEELSKYI